MLVVWGQKRLQSRLPAAWLRLLAAFSPSAAKRLEYHPPYKYGHRLAAADLEVDGGVVSCAALFYATETVFGMRAEGMRHAWSRLFLTDFPHWLPWALATPIVLRLGRWPPPGTKTRWTVWLMHAAVVTVIQAISSAWRAGMIGSARFIAHYLPRDGDRAAYPSPTPYWRRAGERKPEHDSAGPRATAGAA